MYKQMTVKEFIDEVASKSPAPGGGSVSALCGALSSALAGMVCNITIGKKKYAKVEDDMINMLQEIEPLREKLLDDIDRDTEAFNEVMAAYSLPKSSDEEKADRSKAIQESMKEAAKVPLEVAQVSFSILERLNVIAEKGNKNAVTDALVATMLARCAVLGALYNVQINLMSIKDQEFVSRLSDEVNRLYIEAVEMEKEILDKNELR